MSNVDQLSTDRASPTQASGSEGQLIEPKVSEGRFIALVLLAAGVCFLAFVALHGQVESDSNTQVFIDNFVTHVAAQDSWGVAQTLRIVAYLSWMISLGALLRQNARDLAHQPAAYSLLLLGTGLWLLHIAAEFGTAWLMPGHADAPLLGYLEMAKGLRLVDIGILTVAGVTHSLGLVGVGLNILSSPYPKWIGRSLIAVAAPPAIISIILGITSRFSLINPIIYFSVALAFWSIIVGVAMLRRNSSGQS